MALRGRGMPRPYTRFIQQDGDADGIVDGDPCDVERPRGEPSGGRGVANEAASPGAAALVLAALLVRRRALAA